MKKTGSSHQKNSENRLKNGNSLVRLGILAKWYQSQTEDLRNPALLTDCLKDTNPAVNHLAVAVLKKIGPTSIPALIQALDHRCEPDLRKAAAAALASFGTESATAIPALCRCLESEDEQLRWHAGYALAQIGDPALPALEELLKSKKHAVIVSTLASLELMGRDAEKSAEKIETFTDHSDLRIRMQCFATLIKVTGDPSTGLPGLLSLLDQESDPGFCADCLEKIGLLGSDVLEGKEKILRYFTDSSPDVRAAAAISLARTGADFSASETEWLTLLKDSDQDVRSNAVIAIASYGSEASAAIPCLEKMVLQEPSDLAAMANAAITKIIDAPS